MRNPNRIDECCDKLANIWNRVPDWRLSQLMVNAISNYINEHGVEPFYMEDEEFIEYLTDYINKVIN